MLALSLGAGLPSAWADAQQLATSVCVACHGEGGHSVVPTFPNLAGQQQDYLAKQLKDFIEGKRKNEVMAPTIAELKSGDVPGLAAYYAGQKPAPGKVEDAKLAEAGKKLYEDGNTTSGVPACVGCHQPNGVGNTRYPRLAGQHQAYTIQQIGDFKSGTRANDKGRVMRAVAERITEDEMKAVAEYLAGL
ncbi:MAG TPA: c-type cytochrome [Candidatus Desulfobacillus sp.]|nr:c-type cytochrome [Candidatus Desulfobacillus sp.]